MPNYLLIYFLLISVCSVSFVEAQDRSYKLSLVDVGFTDLVDQLEKEYNVRFSYPSDLLKDELFTLKTSTPDLKVILEEISTQHPIEFHILDQKSILLRERLYQDYVPSANEKTVLVKDQLTKKPLVNVAIGIVGTTSGTYTNEEGIAHLSIPPEYSSRSISCHFLGYQTQEKKLDSSSDIIIELAPQPFHIEEVTIQDRMDVLQVKEVNHSIELNTRHISSLASGVMGKDILRQAQLLPGVSAFNDISSGIQIRGAEQQSSLIIIDDIPIYNSSHYYGLFSSINPNYSSSSVLYKNNLPVSYNGKTAGMLKINGPVIDSSRVTGNFDINLLTFSGAVNIPIESNLSLAIAGRTSYNNVSDTDLFSIFNDPQEESARVENFSQSTRDQLLSTVPDFTFSDVNGSLQYNWDNNKIALNYYQSTDDLDDTFENEFLTRRERRVIRNNEVYSNLELWKNRGFSARTDISLSDNITWNTIGYYTNYNNQSGLNISIMRNLPDQTVSGGYTNNRSNIVKDIGINSSVIVQQKGYKLQVGAEIINHDITLDVTERDETVSTFNVSESETSGYISLSHSDPSGLDFEVGYRGTSYRNKYYSSPRINLSYQINDYSSLKMALGRHNQFVREITFENLFGRNLDFWMLAIGPDIKVSSSDNIMAGGSWQHGRVTFDVEGYYRKTYNVLELALENPRLDNQSLLPISQSGGNRYIFFNGDSESIGIDVMVGVTQRQYSGWLSYTLSKSITQYDRILRGHTFPSQDDRRHQLKWVSEYRIGNFTIGANMIYASGRPYTDLTKVVPSLRRDELSSNDRISRLPDYWRSDLGVTYDFDLEGMDASIGLSAFNLFNRQNVNYVQYIFSIVSNSQNQPSRPVNSLLGTESNLLLRTVNLNFSLRF